MSGKCVWFGLYFLPDEYGPKPDFPAQNRTPGNRKYRKRLINFYSKSRLSSVVSYVVCSVATEYIISGTFYRVFVLQSL